jgi:hypothetical protein
MTDDTPALPRRHNRFWLFAPFVLLALAIGGWSTAWVVIRNRTTQALDEWLAVEAVHGRIWSCLNRSVAGYPVRIEVTCDSLSLERPGSRLSVGPVWAVAQVYQPRHVIANVTGPLRAGDGQTAVEGTWRLLQASIRTARDGLQRASLVVDAPALRITGPAPGEFAVAAGHLETHLRPSPAQGAEGAYDWTLGLTRLALPALDSLIGGTEPADVSLEVTATEARDVTARPWAEELERWRAAGGRLDVTDFALAKGARRIEGKGAFGLDEAHRPQGRAELAAVGLEGLLGTFVGARSGATAALIGALTGRPAAPEPAPAPQGGASGLKPLPPLRLEGGRVHVGPLALPGIRLAPLY